MRLAWRHYVNDFYECCWYYYRDGVRYTSNTFIAEYGKDYRIRIENGYAHIIRGEGDLISQFAYWMYEPSRKWILMPYFGGKKRAPKKMIFKVEVK